MRRVALLLAGATALVVLASANAAGTTQIAGLQLADLSCGGTPEVGVFGMEGSLVGCWYTTEITSYRDHPGGTIQLRGTETFVGCLNGTTCGTFNTTFQFTGKYDGPPTFAEIHGRCQHPIVSGTDGFAGATGVVTFRDDVTNGTAPYKGHITVQ